MVYLLKIAIFHGYVSHNQMVNPDGKSHEILISFPWNPPANSHSFPGDGWLAAGLSTLHGWQPLRGIIGDHRTLFRGLCLFGTAAVFQWMVREKPMGKSSETHRKTYRKNGGFHQEEWGVPWGFHGDFMGYTVRNYQLSCGWLWNPAPVGNYW